MGEEKKLSHDDKRTLSSRALGTVDAITRDHRADRALPQVFWTFLAGLRGVIVANIARAFGRSLRRCRRSRAAIIAPDNGKFNKK